MFQNSQENDEICNYLYNCNIYTIAIAIVSHLYTFSRPRLDLKKKKYQ